MRGLAAGLTAAAVAIAVAGCNDDEAAPAAGSSPSERSVDAYCATFYGEGSELHNQWAASSGGDPLTQVVTLVAVPGDMAVFFDKLDKVAPDDIEPDVAAVRDSLKRQLDSLGSVSASDPLSTVLQQFMIGMSSNGSWQRVNDYTASNCEPPPSRTPAATSSASSAAVGGAATVPAVGTRLATVTADGRVKVITSGSGFTVVQSLLVQGQDQSSITTFDAAGRQRAVIDSGFTGECGAADVAPGGRQLIVTAFLDSTPAAGINPAQHSLTLTAWDRNTGARVWESALVPLQDEQLGCSAYSGHLLDTNTGQGAAATTADGAWATVPLVDGAAAVDLATGKIYPRADLLGALGNFVVTGTDDTYYSGDPNDAVVTVPPAWNALGAFQRGPDEEYIGPDFTSGPGGGVFHVISVGSSPTSGMSDSGDVLFDYQESDGPAGGVIRAYSLPGLSQLWSTDVADRTQVHLVAAGGDVLVVRRLGTDDTTTDGLDARTGQLLWSLPEVDVCGVTSTQMLVNVNDQLATIDLASGEQLSFTGNGYEDINGAATCPTLLSGGISVVPMTDGSLAISQALAP
jgi:hypothetical protein